MDAKNANSASGMTPIAFPATSLAARIPIAFPATSLAICYWSSAQVDCIRRKRYRRYRKRYWSCPEALLWCSVKNKSPCSNTNVTHSWLLLLLRQMQSTCAELKELCLTWGEKKRERRERMEEGWPNRVTHSLLYYYMLTRRSFTTAKYSQRSASIVRYLLQLRVLGPFSY